MRTRSHACTCLVPGTPAPPRWTSSLCPSIRWPSGRHPFACPSLGLPRSQDVIPWPALEYVVGQINYGGRVTDDQDRRLLMAILRQYITPDVLQDDYR